MKRSPSVFSLFFAAGIAFLGCSDPEEDPVRLEFEGGALTVAVGDTSEPLSVTKYSTDARGREVVSKPYTSIILTSSDSTVVKVVTDRRVVGLKDGSATITAADEKSEARTKTGRTVTVKQPG